MRQSLNVPEYLEGIQAGNTSILARAISLVESTNPDHRKQAQELLRKLPKTQKAMVIGISGTPGVGKSTFIEAFGNFLLEQGLTLAVLAIDPTSIKTGGSILGDKTRMQKLASHPQAFIRPSASGNTLGGVAAKTRESIFLCEAFGFDVILVETVGVGQSELTVSQMVDFFLLLMQPGSGDDLQGIKRGILEVCQMVAVNKADGELLNKANIAKSEFEMALKILRSQDSYQPKVYTCSALKAQGLQPIWDEIKNYFATQDIIKRRSQQVQSWFDSLMIENINTELKNNKAYNDRRTQATKAISKHSNSVIDLAEEITRELFAGKFNEN